MKNKKRTFKFILFSMVSLLVLTSMLLSVMLGSTNAALIKSLSKKISISAMPDLSFEYYLKDKVNSSGKSGVYKNTKNISQSITTLATAGNTIYRISIPADEVGYYTLSFDVDFWKGTSDKKTDIFVATLDTPVGCQVVHSHQIPIKSGTVYSMAPDDETNNGYVYGAKLRYGTQNLLNAKDHYQWKTLAPSRKEKVNLTYYVDANDVTNGYVTWVWDFTGLANSTQYTLKFTDISITYETPNDESKPYFEFMNTQYVNNTIAAREGQTVPNFYNKIEYENISDGTKPDGTKPKNNSAGVVPSGYTRPNPARGTYVTNGTYDSLTMQASPIYVGWDKTNLPGKFYPQFITGGSNGKEYSDLIVFNVPIKNVKKNVSYRVSFDFSVARQGDNNNLPDEGGRPKDPHTAAITAKDANYSSTYDQMFNDCDPGNSLQFQSYLHNTPEKRYSITDLTSADGRTQVSMLNKRYNMHWLTRYDEIKSVNGGSGNTSCDYTSANANASDSHAAVLNSGTTSLYSSGTGGNGINWYNAIRHSEINGDNKINWLTFYNTSFTFNIDPSDQDVEVDSKGYCNNLFWTWTIDALDQTAWFRIKIDNVRIEEVVQYGSYFDANGMKFGENSSWLTDFFPNGNGTKVNGTVLDYSFRGSNGTGQNFGARGYVSQILSTTNIFGAIYDAGDQNINGDYKISLSGYCVAKGGVEKYVWSADGGKTWYDMVEESPLETPTAQWLKTNADGTQTWVDVTAESLPKNTVYKTTFADHSLNDLAISTNQGASWTAIDYSLVKVNSGQLQIYDGGEWKNAVYIRTIINNSNGVRYYFWSKDGTTWNNSKQVSVPNMIYVCNFGVGLVEPHYLSDTSGLTSFKNITTSNMRKDSSGNLECKINGVWTKCAYVRINTSGNYEYTKKYDKSGWSTTKSSGITRFVLEMPFYALGNQTVFWSDDGAITWHDSNLYSIPTGFTAVNYRKDSILIDAENCVDTCIKNRGVPDASADFVDFNSVNGDTDGIKADFSGGRIYADLSKYKYQHNLDIIFAAVPRSNPLLRCEILRVINYNSTKNYRTYTNEYISDIEVLSSGNKLNATYNATGESTVAFTSMYGLQYVTNAFSSAGGYARRTATTHAYEDIRTLFSNFPIKTSLTMNGWAIVQDGVEKYMWSADYGKSWSDVWASSDLTSPEILTSQRKNWYDGSDAADTTLSINSVFDLTVDLSEYIGQVVDIIVVAKPNGSDALCPVGRIDNVAVYGDPEASEDSHRGMGPFYSNLQSVALDSVVVDSRVTKELDDVTYLNGGSAWLLNADKEERIAETAYTVYEPYNVNPISARSYNNIYNTVSRGGSVTIDGFIGCHGGVKAFKYSFDGIEWTDIDLQGQDVVDAGSDIVTIINEVADATYDATQDVALSDYSGTHAFTFNLPQNVTGKKDLFVVAESTNGYKYPVLSIKLDIIDTLAVTSDGKATLKLPVTEAGTYNLNYSSYSRFDSPNTSAKTDKGSSMTASNTVCRQGEIVTVDYNAGGKNTSNNDAWIGYYNINVSSEGGYIYLDSNTGTYTIDTSNLLGFYKIYFVDNDSARDDTANYLAEPIVLTVLNEEVFTPYRHNSLLSTKHSISIEKQVFTIGEAVKFKVDGNVNYKSMSPWVAITPYDSVNYNTYWTWASDYATSPIGTSGLTAGRYKLYYLVGTGATVNNGTDSAQFAVIDIYLLDNNSLNKVTVSGTVNDTELPALTQSNLSYGNNVNQNITVTEEDVQRGYVEINYSLTGLTEGASAELIIKDLHLTKK